jgi:haloalkane dehalogenase
LTARQRGETIRNTGAGEEMVLQQDLFIRQAFTGGGVLTPIDDQDLQAYLDPYPTPESRRPILAWARQMPLGGEPADVVSRIEAFDMWLAHSVDVPKLLVTFEGSPTLLIDDNLADWCAANIASLETVAGGQAGHHAPEDRPDEIATAINVWIDRHQLR